MLRAKLYNSRSVLQRAIRDHALRIDVDKFRDVADRITRQIGEISEAQSLESLRGIEGIAAAAYFSVANDLLLQQKEQFVFTTRNRRPPLDPVNALLSFTYTLLAHDTAAALESVGLDAYVGFLHRDRPGRASLALDLMEELRPVVADRFVLTLINTRKVHPEGFSQKENGAVIMSDETRRAVLTAWQSRKQKETMHPFLNEKMEWGLVPYAQALLLARHLRGDLDEYPPFLWR